ncbi:MAG: nitroreductase family protein [Gallionella sp.]|nr:nitroreductase family protein [Gallionella sp.]
MDGLPDFWVGDAACFLLSQFIKKKSTPVPLVVLVGLSSIHWREAWKYGERAYRYCQHDVGHAIAAVRFAAAALGWQARVLSSWSDGDVGAMLGVDRDADFAGTKVPESISFSSTPSVSLQKQFDSGTFRSIEGRPQYQSQFLFI